MVMALPPSARMCSAMWGGGGGADRVGLQACWSVVLMRGANVVGFWRLSLGVLPRYCGRIAAMSDTCRDDYCTAGATFFGPCALCMRCVWVVCGGEGEGDGGGMHASRGGRGESEEEERRGWAAHDARPSRPKITPSIGFALAPQAVDESWPIVSDRSRPPTAAQYLESDSDDYGIRTVRH